MVCENLMIQQNPVRLRSGGEATAGAAGESGLLVRAKMSDGRRSGGGLDCARERSKASVNTGHKET